MAVASPALYELYMSLLKSSLTGRLLLDEPPLPPIDAEKLLEEAIRRFGDALTVAITPEVLSWLLNMNARRVATLAPPAQLDTLQRCLETVVSEGINGDVIEAGCGRGGQCALMSGTLLALGATDRTILGADSFEGLPEPDSEHAPDDALFAFFLDAIGRFRWSREQTETLLDRYGLRDERFQAIPGWFHESLPAAGLGSLAFIRLDATFYQSTRDALRVLYPHLSPGGYVLCADYEAPTGARRAVDEYRRAAAIYDPLEDIDGQGVLWRKS